MDEDDLKRQLTERFQRSLDKAPAAVDGSRDGKWIAAGEWQVRDVSQRLTADCFGVVVQGRIDRLPPTPRAAFSPGGRGNAAAAELGAAAGAGADGRRAG